MATIGSLPEVYGFDAHFTFPHALEPAMLLLLRRALPSPAAALVESESGLGTSAEL